MSDRVDLNALVEEVVRSAPDLAVVQPVVAKELIHYDILQALDDGGVLRNLTFHGGTALRLCYGSERLSEDLDFAGGPDFTRDAVEGISEVIKSHLSRRFGLEVSVREPRPRKREGNPVAVDTWQISVVTDPGNHSLPRQRVKIDIAAMVAWTREVRPIRTNYPVLPTGLGDLLVPCMSKDEIMANKLVSLPASGHQRNIRYRDIWDLAWLSRNAAKPDYEWVTARAAEFGYGDYADRLDAMIETLPMQVASEQFRNEMARFLPGEVTRKTFDRPEFLSYLVDEVGQQLTETKASRRP